MREENLYQRAGVYWLRATIRGREYRESLRTRDVKSARRLRDKRIEELGAALWHGERRHSWREAVTAWLEHVAGQIAPATIKRYAVSIAQCEAHLSPLDVAKIDGKVLADLIGARRKLGASPATIRRDLTAISRVLEYAEAMEWREGNPTLSKRKLLKERRDPIALPTAEAIAAMLEASSARFAALIVAARLTGCRQDELVRLPWRAFNPAAKTLDVIGKGNKRRTLALSDAATAHFTAQPHTLESGLIFCREGGEIFSQAASDFCHFRRLVVKKSPDFRRFRFHDLRHLFAVEALRGGMDIYTLSKHLGHTSVKTTEIYLAFLSPEEADAARDGTAQKTAQSRRFASAEIA
jgi:integrase/recombinase XerD